MAFVVGTDVAGIRKKDVFGNPIDDYNTRRPLSKQQTYGNSRNYISKSPINYGISDQPSLYDQFKAQLEAERQNRINKIKDSIMSQVEMSVRGYESQRPDIKNNYQNLKNQSEVERYNQARLLRESQANRGALDSGVGRQENLAMQNNYGNALNSINQAEQKDLNELNRAIEDIRAQGSMQMALAEADAAGDFSTALNVGFQNYGDTANYANAAAGIKRAVRSKKGVTSTTGIGQAKTMSDLNQAILNNQSANTNQAYLETLKRKFNKDDSLRLFGTTR